MPGQVAFILAPYIRVVMQYLIISSYIVFLWNLFCWHAGWHSQGSLKNGTS